MFLQHSKRSDAALSKTEAQDTVAVHKPRSDCMCKVDVAGTCNASPCDWWNCLVAVLLVLPPTADSSNKHATPHTPVDPCLSGLTMGPTQHDMQLTCSSVTRSGLMYLLNSMIAISGSSAMAGAPTKADNQNTALQTQGQHATHHQGLLHASAVETSMALKRKQKGAINNRL